MSIGWRPWSDQGGIKPLKGWMVAVKWGSTMVSIQTKQMGGGQIRQMGGRQEWVSRNETAFKIKKK
jgi:hypothetical protein